MFIWMGYTPTPKSLVASQITTLLAVTKTQASSEWRWIIQMQAKEGRSWYTRAEILLSGGSACLSAVLLSLIDRAALKQRSSRTSTRPLNQWCNFLLVVVIPLDLLCVLSAQINRFPAVAYSNVNVGLVVRIGCKFCCFDVEIYVDVGVCGVCFFQNRDWRFTFQKVLFAVLISKSIDRLSGTLMLWCENLRWRGGVWLGNRTFVL